jgi:translation initiation factor 2D
MLWNPRFLVTCPLGFTNAVEIDAAFKKAALYGLYDLKVSEKQSTISLPLTSSTFVASHLNPYLPRSFAQYNFKKTSWKKAATFLKKYMEKEGIMKTKDRGGETVIMTINWSHKLINEFEAYDLDPRELDKGTNDTGTTPTVAQPAQLRELFKPGKVLKNILESQAKS